MLLTVLVVLSLGAYRVTRFIVDDGLWKAQREWLLRRILRKWQVDFDGEVVPDPQAEADGLIAAWRLKLHELLTCPYCMSVWVSAGMVAVASVTWSVPAPFWTWLGVCGAAIGLYMKIEH